jgi:hypothetical protein
LSCLDRRSTLVPIRAPARSKIATGTALALVALASCAAISASGEVDERLGCGTAIPSDRDDGRRGKRDVVVGPVRLVSIRRYARYRRSKFRPSRRRGDFSAKVPLLIEQGSSLRIAIGPRARRRAALTYAPSARTARRVRGGHSALEFNACDDAALSFWPGGFLVHGAQCVPLRLWVDGAETPRKLRVAFGRGTC